MNLFRLVGQLWNQLFASRIQDEIDDELALHLELLVARYQREGTDLRTARRLALRRFGSFERTRSACSSVYGLTRSTGTSKGTIMLNIWQDIRYAIRNLLRQPGFTVVAVLTLAVGIAASTVMFSAVNSTLLNPVPFADGDRMVRVWHQSPSGGMRFAPDPVTVNTWRERAGRISEITTSGAQSMIVRLGNEPERMLVAEASVGVLAFLGLQPQLGRTFLPGDTIAGQNHVLMLTDRAWRRLYQRDKDVVGSTLSLNDEPYTIIGVAPALAEAFFYYRDNAPLDYSLIIPHTSGGSSLLKLGPDVSLAQAEQELGQLFEQVMTETETPAGWPVQLSPMGASVSENMETGLWVLLGAVGFVLLVACINVANMLLVRGVARSHELAMRKSLGATTGRMARQLLVESVLITGTATLISIIMTTSAIDLLRNHVPQGLSALRQARFDLPVLSVAIAITAVITIAFSLVPLGQVRKLNLTSLLETGRSGGWNPARSRLRSSLVAIEVAMATILFVGAGLMTRTLINLASHDPGFAATNLISFSMELPEQRYPDAPARSLFINSVRTRMADIPAVQAQAVGSVGMLGAMEAAIQIQGAAEAAPSRLITVALVSDGFFEAMGMRMNGRGFTPQELSEAARYVMVVNQAFERAYYGGESAVGKTFRIGDSENWITVAGVVPDVKMSGMHDDIESLQIYRPHTVWDLSNVSFIVRTIGDPVHAVSQLKAAAWTVDSNIPLYDIEVASDKLSEANARPRFTAMVLTAFALSGLLLAGVGVYTVVSMAQQYRKHELGVRMALGATSGDTLRLMLAYGMKPVFLGAAVGVFASIGLGRFLQTLLYQVAPADPLTYIMVITVLAATALAASWLPARRAQHIDPVDALRCQ